MKWLIILGCVVISTYGVPRVSLAQDHGKRPENRGPDQGVLGMPVEMNEDLSKMPVDLFEGM